MDAKPYLLKIIEKESRHFSGMFLLAQVYGYEGQRERAIELYDTIIRKSEDQAQKENARDFKRQLIGGKNGK
jgi:hypothetical protein